MAVSAHNITTKKDIVKELQWITEGDSVATPSLFGTTPASSAFAVVGNNTDISIKPDVRHFDVNVLGSEDIIDAVKTESLYTFGIKFNPINTGLFKYAWNASGLGTGCIDESLSFAYSYYIDGVENYQYMRGCRPTSATLSVSRGQWDCDMNFVAKDITVPSATDGNTTPTYASAETTSSPIVHSDGGGSPFTWNSANFGERSFSTTVSRGLAVMSVNGESDITYCKPVTRSITFNADVFTKNKSLYQDFEDKAMRTASYKFTSSPSKTLTYAKAVITDYGYTHAAGSGDALIESITARAESVTDL